MLIPEPPRPSGGERFAAERAEWEAGAPPRAMLAALRARLAGGGAAGPTWAEEEALRAFVLRCARQRCGDREAEDASDERALARHLVAVADGRAAGRVTRGEADAARRLAAGAALRAVGRLTDPRLRRGAASLLAAFHALEPDAMDAAVRVSAMVERYGAASEAGARTIRAEQAAWLHELFGMDPFAPPPSPARPEPGPWIIDERLGDGRWEPALAARMRYLVRYRDSLLATDRWIAVPQSSCGFVFGVGRRPLPIGALCMLWDRWAATTGECPSCGGRVVCFAMGGTPNVGGLIGCCLVCERQLRRPMDGLAAVAEAMAPILDGTEYEVSGMRSHRMQHWPQGKPDEFDAAVGEALAGEVMG